MQRQDAALRTGWSADSMRVQANATGLDCHAEMETGELRLLPDKVLQRKIADLKKLEQRCFASRQRFQFYQYLEAVYDFYAFLRRRNEARKTARRIAELS